MYLGDHGALLYRGSSPNSDLFGQRIKEPILQEIIHPPKEFRILPPLPDDGNPASGGQSGSVTHEYFPDTWICMGQRFQDEKNPKHPDNGKTVSHIEKYPAWDKVKKQYICNRKGCDRITRPSNFVSLCKRGHLDTFDYYFWMHEKESGCNRANAVLDLVRGSESSFTLADWVIKCRNPKCKSQPRDMAQVPYQDPEHPTAPNCRGRRPWLSSGEADQEGCGLGMTHRQVGNVSVTYNEGASVLLVSPHVTWSLGEIVDLQIYRNQVSEILARPDPKDPVEEIIGLWDKLDQLSPATNKKIMEFLEGTSWADDHERFLRQLCDYYRVRDGEQLSLGNMKDRERLSMIMEEQGFSQGDDFSCYTIAGGDMPVPDEWEAEDWPVSVASRLDKLTELKVISGIRRLDPNSEIDGEKVEEQPIDIPPSEASARTGPDETYGIGMYNHGEGVYFDLKPAWVEKMANSRINMFNEPKHEHASMKHSRARIPDSIKRQNPSLDDDAGALSHSAFTVVHTLSHLMIREFSSMSGFSLGSIRERIYLNAEENRVNSAGILLYTAGPSSDGTLGGLVQQGSSIGRINTLIRRSLENLGLCSNDPICKDHQPTLDETNGASCHTCCLLPETSCELMNHMLDRNWGG